MRIHSSPFRTDMSKLVESVKKCVPMICVPGVAAALSWYASIGFRGIARYADEGLVNFGMVSFGKNRAHVQREWKARRTRELRLTGWRHRHLSA